MFSCCCYFFHSYVIAVEWTYYHTTRSSLECFFRNYHGASVTTKSMVSNKNIGRHTFNVLLEVIVLTTEIKSWLTQSWCFMLAHDRRCTCVKGLVFQMAVAQSVREFRKLWRIERGSKSRGRRSKDEDRNLKSVGFLSF